MTLGQLRIQQAKNLGWRSIRPISMTGFPPWYGGNNETYLEPIPKYNQTMKSVTIKTTLIVDGREYLVNSQDFRESIAEYESEQEYELDDKEIISYISEQ